LQSTSVREEIEIAKFWANRSGDAVIVRLVQYESRWFVDIRRHASEAGKFVPTKKGLFVLGRKLPELIKALNKAERHLNGGGE
jgi:hypothetical protein